MSIECKSCNLAFSLSFFSWTTAVVKYPKVEAILIPLQERVGLLEKERKKKKKRISNQYSNWEVSRANTEQLTERTWSIERREIESHICRKHGQGNPTQDTDEKGDKTKASNPCSKQSISKWHSNGFSASLVIHLSPLSFFSFSLTSLLFHAASGCLELILA